MYKIFSFIGALNIIDISSFFLFMIIGLTGTPGTGKTSVSGLLEKKRSWKVIHLNDLIKEKRLYTEIDEKRDAVIADMELIREYLQETIDGNELKREQGGEKDVVIIESHLAHHIADIVIVLRAYPLELEMRLNTRGYSEEKIKENVEAEALDVILVEAFEWCKKVFEVNTTGKSIEEVGQDIEKIIDNMLNGNEVELSEYKPGSINWIDLVP
jgi:adenylate kinase